MGWRSRLLDRPRAHPVSHRRRTNGGQFSWRGKRYALPRHGFARNLPFEVIRNEERDLLFRLSHNADTLKYIPFQFELDVAFRLEGQALEIEATVRNVGDEPMPASIGFHPAFRWPLPYGGERTAHSIEFPFEEAAPVRRLDALGLLAPVRQHAGARSQPRPGRCAVRKDVLIFDGLDSRQLLSVCRARSAWP